MIEFHGVINNRIIIAKSLQQLKRLASRESNKTFNVIDIMRVTVHDVRKSENVDILTFQRINRIVPNGIIQRGKWK